MIDYEDLILERQESEADECATCPHKVMECNNQCMEIEWHSNPFVSRYLATRR